jgi:hypothetical protein
MQTDVKSTDTFNVILSVEEKETILQLLETSLGETRVEVHRTHTPDFRDKVKHREVVTAALIEKFRRPNS